MPGPTTEFTYQFHYKTSDSSTAPWVEFDPVGGTPVRFTMQEGRGRSTSATLAARYQITWELDTPTEFQVFDVLREGLPFRVRLVQAAYGWSPLSIIGWITEPAVENLNGLTVSVTATDGIGKLGGIDVDDFVFNEMDANWNIYGYWPMNESEGTQIWPRVFEKPGWGGVPGGWYRDVSNHQAEPLRRSLGQSVQMSKSQSFTFPADTEINQTTEHTLCGSFKLTDTETLTRLLVGLVDSGGDIETVGLMVYDGVVNVRYGAVEAASFTATVGTTYVFALSWAIVATEFSVRWRIKDAATGAVQLSGGTPWITAPAGTFTILQGGPVDAVVGDLYILDDGLFNANMDLVIDDLRGMAGDTSSEQLEGVCTLLDVGVESVAAKGETISAPIGEMVSAGKWVRELEALEQGAIWWDSNAGQFKFETLAELQAASSVKTFDQTTGDYTSYTAGSRVWGPVRNDVTISSPALDYHLSDTASVAEFGRHSVSVSVPEVDRTVLISTADRVLELYDTPRRYHPSLSVDMAAADDWDMISSPALFDKITVTWPDGVGNQVTVIGRQLQVSAGVDEAVLTLHVADMSEATGSAPAVTTVPTISGTFDLGETLTAVDGTWTDSLRETGQWQISFNGGTTVSNLGGADGQETTIGIDSRHSGAVVRRRVGAWNGIGPTVFAYSSWSTVIGGATNDGFGEGAFGTDTFGE